MTVNCEVCGKGFDDFFRMTGHKSSHSRGLKKGLRRPSNSSRVQGQQGQARAVQQGPQQTPARGPQATDAARASPRAIPAEPARPAVQQGPADEFDMPESAIEMYRNKGVPADVLETANGIYRKRMIEKARQQAAQNEQIRQERERTDWFQGALLGLQPPSEMNMAQKMGMDALTNVLREQVLKDLERIKAKQQEAEKARAWLMGQDHNLTMHE